MPLGRCGIITAINDADPRTSIWSLRRPRWPMPGSNLSHCVMGILVVIGCALAGMAWDLFPHREAVALHAPSISKERQAKNVAAVAAVRHRVAHSLDQESAFWQGDPTKRAINSTLLPRPVRTWVTQQAQVVGGVIRGIVEFMASVPADPRRTSVAVERAAGEAADAIGRAAALVHQAIVTALPRFMDLLRLSDRQRRELDEIVRSTREATNEIYRRSRQLGTQQAMHEINRIRQSAGDRVLTLLSPAQADKLRSLIASGRRGRP
jgi:hypothetical protein